jgi:replication-associated recombination protein RarA
VLIRSLVENSADFSDIISGKGGGCIFLLHGSPGVGKVRTTIARHTTHDTTRHNTTHDTTRHTTHDTRHDTRHTTHDTRHTHTTTHAP